MKLATQRDIGEYTQHIAIGGLKGFSLGVLASLGLSAILKHRTRVLHIPGGYHRVMIMIAPGMFGGVVGADWATTSFEDLQRKRQHLQKGIDLTEASTQTKPQSINRWNRFTHWLDGHKYRAIVGGWAAALAGSFALVNRDIYLSRAQKLVQARVYAQGLTVLMLLASVAIKVTYSDSEKNTRESREAAESSWQRGLAFVRAANTAANSKTTADDPERITE